MLLVMGDFNARVGSDTVAWQGTIGKFGPEEWNENGVKLLEFCIQYPGSHKHIVPAQLMSPMDLVSSSRVNQIRRVLDYIVNRHFRTSFLDIRVYRKTYLQSDHWLV